MRKMLLSIWAACGLGTIFAQTGDSLSYTDLQDQRLQHLNKDRIPSGVLYDRAYPWADLTGFLDREDKTIDYRFARQA